jgi:aspartyl-tRNA(Asn)/glutamyl-tRNA(Gln) amidotransferase subunit A
VDVLVSPTAPTTAFKLGEKFSDPLSMYLNDLMTIPVNLAGLPGMSVPCGLASNGLPVGLQIVGNVLREDQIFQVAYAYEQATGWGKQGPKL